MNRLREYVQWLAVLCCLGLLGCGPGVQGGGKGVGSPPKPKERKLVFIVHGTWSGKEEWPKVEPGLASFASELARGLGPNTEIYPFLWETSIFHEKREAAAQNLAERIDEKSPHFERIYLVGHSHGGNVALLAAGRCLRRIEKIVCLSTPHVYLSMANHADQPVFVPVYCSQEAVNRVGEIISLWPRTDSVPSEFSNRLLKGVTENEALQLSRRWQEELGHPRSPNDTFLGRLLERFNETIGLRLFESGHLLASPTLKLPKTNVGNIKNLEICSLIEDPLQSHAAVHSRRMGYLVGGLLHNGMRPQEQAFLRGLVQPADADDGTPIPVEDHKQWLARNKTAFKRVGWRMQQVEITLLADVQRLRNAKKPAPQAWIRIAAQGQASGYKYRGFELAVPAEKRAAGLTTPFVVFDGDTGSLDVLDRSQSGVLERIAHWVQPDTALGVSLGKVSLPSASPPAAISGAPEQGRYWSAQIDWIAAHY